MPLLYPKCVYQLAHFLQIFKRYQLDFISNKNIRLSWRFSWFLLFKCGIWNYPWLPLTWRYVIFFSTKWVNPKNIFISNMACVPLQWKRPREDNSPTVEGAIQTRWRPSLEGEKNPRMISQGKKSTSHSKGYCSWQGSWAGGDDEENPAPSLVWLLSPDFQRTPGEGKDENSTILKLSET